MDKPKRGRPPALNDEAKRGQIYGVLGVGGSMRLAAYTVGCYVRTIYYTMERDAEFKRRCKEARAGQEIRMLKHIDDAAANPRYWRAAAWKLERTHPDRYQAKRHVGMVPVEHTKKFIEELATALADELDNVPDGDAIYERVCAKAAGTLTGLAMEADGTLERVLDYAEQPEDPPADAA